ncbi:MAG TPA: hypothetical protein P5049_05995 [Methanothrix sp.]|nr:hypothetical protein [Methanothrix sp.]
MGGISKGSSACGFDGVGDNSQRGRAERVAGLGTGWMTDLRMDQIMVPRKGLGVEVEKSASDRASISNFEKV